MTTVRENEPKVREFANSFFSSFYPESLVLGAVSRFYQFPPLHHEGRSDEDDSAQNTPVATTFGSGFFRVVEETDQEMLLDAGGTQTWLSVEQKQHSSSNEVEYKLGSVVKKVDVVTRCLIPAHQWYSKVLLSGAIRHHHESSSSE